MATPSRFPGLLYSNDPRIQAELNLQQGGFIPQVLGVPADNDGNSLQLNYQTSAGKGTATGGSTNDNTGDPKKMSDLQLEAEIAALSKESKGSVPLDHDIDKVKDLLPLPLNSGSEGTMPINSLSGQFSILDEINHGTGNRDGQEGQSPTPRASQTFDSVEAGNSNEHPLLTAQQKQLDETRARKEALKAILREE